MNWFKDHVFIATWLGPVIAITIAIMKGKREAKEGWKFDWFRLVLYFTFFLCLSVTFTPQFDDQARATAKLLIYPLLGAILIYK